jgi:hypothetical protein
MFKDPSVAFLGDFFFARWSEGRICLLRIANIFPEIL